MKVYRKPAFLALPAGTLFQFGPSAEGILEVAHTGINVKHDTRQNDFTYTPIIDVDCSGSQELFELSDERMKQAYRTGVSDDIPADFEASRGEERYTTNDDDLYVVFGPTEIRSIIAILETLV